MIGWLYRIIIGSFHKHQWVDHKEIELFTEYSRAGDRAIGTRFIQKCNACGAVRKRDVY